MNKKEKRTIYLLGVTSLINDTSSEVIYSLLPYYIKSKALIGILGGLFDGLGSIIRLFFGYLSDKLKKRKIFVLLGYLISAFAKTMMAFVSIIFLPIFIILDRIGKGIRSPPRDAILGALRERGHAFGLHRALDTVGAIFGTILAYFLLCYVKEYRTSIFIGGIISFFSIIPLLFLKEVKVRKKAKDIVSSVKEVSKKLGFFILPMILFGFSSISPMLFIGVSKERIGKVTVLFYTLYNISYIFSSFYFGRKSDVLGRKMVMVLGGIMMSISFLSMCIATKGISIFFILSFLFYGMGRGMFDPVAFAYIGDIARLKGVAMGVFQAVYGASILVSSSIFGVLYELIGSLAFLLYSEIPLIAVFFIELMKK